MKLEDMLYCLCKGDIEILKKIPVSYVKKYIEHYIDPEKKLPRKYRVKFKQNLADDALQSFEQNFLKMGAFKSVLAIRACHYLEKNKLLKSSYKGNDLVEKLFLLPESDLYAAHKLIVRLSKAKLLNKGALDEVFKTVGISLEDVEPLQAKRHYYLKGGKFLHKYKLKSLSGDGAASDDRPLKYSFSRKQQGIIAAGGYGYIRKGEMHARPTKKKLAIKTFDDEVDDKFEEASLEAQCHRLLYPDRESFSFFREGSLTQNQEVSFCYEWFDGVPLGSLSLMQLSITQLGLKLRLTLIKTLLEPIESLHAHFRVNGDINYANVIADLGKNKLQLIDFGFVRKPYTMEPYAFYANFADKYLLEKSMIIEKAKRTDSATAMSASYAFSDDLYATAIIFASFFPELFKSYGRYGFYEKDYNDSNKLILEQKAVRDLVMSIYHVDDPENNRKLRASMATAAMALDYANQVLDDWDRLSKKRLRKIGDKTIYKKDITVDDVIYGHLRPLTRG